MTLIEAFEQGKVLDFGVPDRVIDSMLSKVFIFGERVTKVYKHKKAFYGDLADDQFRKEFYAEDFYWNHVLAPDVYTKLVAVDGDSFIEMTCIDSEKTLTKLLPMGAITREVMQNLTAILVQRLRDISFEHRAKLESLFARGMMSLHLESLEDLRSWGYVADTYIPRPQTDRIVDLLINSSKDESYFLDEERHHISAAIDNNPDNVLIIDGKVSFMDIMPPKENWRVADEYFTIVRSAVDGFVLGGEELGLSIYETYAQFQKDIPKIITLIYEIRSGMIQWAYRHILGQHDVAEKYREFTEKRVEELERYQNIL